MIKVVFQAGVGLIYNVDDWFELRTKYHIVGEFFGLTKISQVALPVALCPEQLYILQKNQIIVIVKWNKLSQEPTAEDKIFADNELKYIHTQQEIILQNEREKQVELYIDNIIKGKKLENTPREQIIQEEINKLPKLQLENIITPICTEHPKFLRGTNFDEILVSEILQYTTRIKCLIYEDLWKRNYFITSGRKFGGDFLVYLQDPVLFHAFYIIKCVENNDELRNVTEIVALGRLGHSVKKKFVLAGINTDDTVSYITIDWFDSE